MFLNTFLDNSTKAFILSLFLHSSLIGTLFYFSTDTPKKQDTKMALALSLCTHSVPTPTLQAPPKPKSTPPKPKPKPKKITPTEPKVTKPKPKKEKQIPIEKEPLIQEEQVQVQEQKVQEEPDPQIQEEPTTQEIETTKEPVEVQKTAQQIAQENEALRLKQEENFIQTNFSIIRDMALENLVYPRMAHKRGWSGVVEVKLVVSAQGKLLEASIHKSSGRESLDKAALRSVSYLKDKNLPKPQGLTTLYLPISFRIN